LAFESSAPAEVAELQGRTTLQGRAPIATSWTLTRHTFKIVCKLYPPFFRAEASAMCWQQVVFFDYCLNSTLSFFQHNSCHCSTALSQMTFAVWQLEDFTRNNLHQTD